MPSQRWQRWLQWIRQGVGAKFIGVGICLFIALFTTNLVPWAFGSCMKVDPALQRVRKCPELEHALGKNIGLAFFGTQDCSGGGTTRSGKVRIAGNKASATMSYKMQKRYGEWKFAWLDVKVDGKEIDILHCIPGEERPSGHLSLTSDWLSWTLKPDQCEVYSSSRIELTKKGRDYPQVSVYGFRKGRPHLYLHLSKMDKVWLYPREKMDSRCRVLDIAVKNRSTDRNKPLFSGSVKIDCDIKTDDEGRKAKLMGTISFDRCK